MTNDEIEALKPCPFCGMGDMVEITLHGDKWWIKCNRCPSIMIRSNILNKYPANAFDNRPETLYTSNENRDILIKAWNTRARPVNQEMLEAAKKLKRKRGKLLQTWHNKYIFAKLEDCSKKELEEIVDGYHRAMRLHYEYNCHEQAILSAASGRGEV